MKLKVSSGRVLPPTTTLLTPAVRKGHLFLGCLMGSTGIHQRVCTQSHEEKHVRPCRTENRSASWQPEMAIDFRSAETAVCQPRPGIIPRASTRKQCNDREQAKRSTTVSRTWHVSRNTPIDARNIYTRASPVNACACASAARIRRPMMADYQSSSHLSSSSSCTWRFDCLLTAEGLEKTLF